MGEPLPPSPSNKGSECYSLEESLESREETQHQKFEMGGETHKNDTINVPNPSSFSVLSMQSKGTQTIDATSYAAKDHRVNTTDLTTLDSKAILIMGFSALIGLLSVTYSLNRNGNLIPNTLLHRPPIAFTFFLVIIMIIFYVSAIGIIIQKFFPMITKVLNFIAFVCLVLGVTVLLWDLIPNTLSWVPWIFFACTVVVAFGALAFELFADKSSTRRSAALNGSSPTQLSTV